MSLLNTIIDIKGIAKDIKRDLLLSGERLFLLKRRGETGTKWTVVDEITEGWIVRWNEYRAQMSIDISTAEENFRDKMAQTSFIAYGVPVSNVMEVYTIDPDRRDIIPPTGSNSDWKVYVTKDPKEKFVIAV